MALLVPLGYFWFFFITTYALPSSPSTRYVATHLDDRLPLARAELIKPASIPINPNILDSSLTNQTNGLTYFPVCNSPPLFAIAHPKDCNKAKRILLTPAGASKLTNWYFEQRWTHGSCGIFLMPNERERNLKDLFSRLEIARDATFIANDCVTQLHGFRGGSIPIGKGSFEVAVLGKAQSGMGWDSVIGNYTRSMQ